MSKEQKKREKNFKLFHKATVTMSLLSWYTTYNGFKDSVFSNGQEMTAGLASLAIQVVLLGGVLQLFPMLGDILRNAKDRIITLKKSKKRFRAVKIGFVSVGYSFMGIFVVVIFLTSMCTSIMFSYVSISNNIYETDFAVNANIKLDKFMRTTIQEMETDTEEYIDAMRKRIISELKENGEKIIESSANRKGRDFAKTNGEILKVVETKELVSLNKKFGKIYKKALLRGEKVEYRYKSIKKEYVDKMFKDFIKANNLGNTQFAGGLKNKINNLNRDKYAIYGEYHYQYEFAVNLYNSWILELRKKNGKAPSLEQMKSFCDYCKLMEDGLNVLKEKIDKIKEWDDFAEKNTERLVNEAIMNMDSLILEVGIVKEKVNSLQKNTYGEKSLSFEELISAFGSSETKKENLNNAREQLLNMQGVLLSEAEEDDGTINKIKELIHDLEKYIDAVEYSKEINALKLKISTNYNIVNEPQVVQDDVIEKSMDSARAASGTAVSATAAYIAIDVTSETWTKEKKVQMTELNAMIYSQPVYLFCDQAERGKIERYLEKEENNTGVKEKNSSEEENKNGIKQIYKNYKKKANNYRKHYLDTSEMEKAYDLILGKDSLFPHKKKAIIALAFAVFLDFGAFMIGTMLFLIQKRGKSEGSEKDEKSTKKCEKKM